MHACARRAWLHAAVHGPHLEDGVQVVGRDFQPIIVQDEGGVGAGKL